MNKTIRLKIRKEVNAQEEKNILKLKGLLVSQSYTDIIHISDDGEVFYINSFVTQPEKSVEAIDYIKSYVQATQLGDILEVL